MGTRADFYVGRGESAEWLGSIGMDGYPSGIDAALLRVISVEAFRACVAETLRTRSDATWPDMGWPWPWDNSRTTDYAYAFDAGRVWASNFGGAWFAADGSEPNNDEGAKVAVFPDMASRKRVATGRRSGLIIIGPNGIIER